jgi:hypothetical protein
MIYNNYYQVDNMALYNYIIISIRWICGTLGGHTIILQWFKNEY